MSEQQNVQDMTQERQIGVLATPTSTSEPSTDTNAIESVDMQDERMFSAEAIRAEMDRRNEQDFMWRAVSATGNGASLSLCRYIANKSKGLSGTQYKAKLLDQIYPGALGAQGNFIRCPLDIHKGPFFYGEDKYTFIYGEETEKNIHDNCNEALFMQIDNTEITEGMMKRAEGHNWLNGVVLYNKNSIVIREADNNFGQPGFMRGAFYYDKLGVEVMKRYIVPRLIKEVNDGTINSITGYNDVAKIITETYETVYTNKINALNQANIEHLNEVTLFADAPRAEKLNKADKSDVSQENLKKLQQIIESKDRRIDSLEKKVESLSSQLNMILGKLNDLEEIVLTESIRVNKQ